MGNAILKHYDVSDKQLTSGGMCMLWKGYQATHKETKKRVTAFVLKKSSLPKALRCESFYARLEAEASRLSKLRHPQVLQIVQPLDVSRDAFVLVTEPVMCSLANVMRDYTNMDKVPEGMKKLRLPPLEVKSGLRQVAEALQFCHQECNLLHNYVDPCNIFVTSSGHWKLAGFYFAQEVASLSEAVPSGLDYSPYGSGSEPVGLPSFNYVSPEIGMTKKNDYRADIFSLAKVALEVHRVFPDPAAGGRQPRPTSKLRDQSEFSRHLSQLHPLVLDGVPPSLHDVLRRMLAQQADARPSLHEFLDCSFFDDMLVRALLFLDTLLDKELEARVEFLKRLPQALDMFDKRTCKQRVLPPLLLQLQDHSMRAFALPSVLKICKNLSVKEFASKAGRHLAPLMKPQPPLIAYFMMQHVEMLIDKSPPKVVKGYVLPMLLRGLDSDEAKLRKVTLQQLVAVARKNKFDYKDLKDKVLPKVTEIATAPGKLSARVGALECLRSLFPLYDTATISEIREVFQIALRSHEPRSADVIEACVEGLDAIGRHMGFDVCASHVIPAIAPALAEDVLSAQQFARIIEKLRDLVTRVESLRQKKLEKATFIKQKEAEQSRALSAMSVDDNPFDQASNAASFQDLLAKEYGGKKKPTPAPQDDGDMFAGLSQRPQPQQPQQQPPDESSGLFAGLSARSQPAQPAQPAQPSQASLDMDDMFSGIPHPETGGDSAPAAEDDPFGLFGAPTAPAPSLDMPSSTTPSLDSDMFGFGSTPTPSSSTGPSDPFAHVSTPSNSQPAAADFGFDLGPAPSAGGGAASGDIFGDLGNRGAGSLTVEDDPFGLLPANTSQPANTSNNDLSGFDFL